MTARTAIWWDPVVGKLEETYIIDVLRSQYINQGKKTEEFEIEIAKLINVRYAVAVTSGTTAITAGLMACGIGPGDEVIVPDFSFVATANAVTLAGATPVLVDVNEKTFNIDPNQIKKSITSKTRAILPVHVSGRGADMDAIWKIAIDAKLMVVEDAAEALFSKYQGEFLGTGSQAGCFSFSPNKTITTGQGGIVVTDDTEIFERLKSLRDQGRTKPGTGGDDIHPFVGFNFKFTNLQAAIGLAQLTYLAERIERIRSHATIYLRELGSVKELTLPGFNLAAGECPQWVDASAGDRDQLLAHLEKKNIHCRKFWHPIHKHGPYKDSDANFPNTTMISKNGFWLPSAYTLSAEDIEFVCDEIKSFYKG